MKLENQVVSLELSQKLKELGVKQESLFYWCGNPGVEYRLSPTDKGHRIETGGNGMFCSAYTVAELGEMLEVARKTDFINAYCEAMALTEGQLKYAEMAHVLMTQPDVGATMIIHLLENKLITL